MLITDLVYIDSTGYHYADYPSFLEWLTAAYKGIYGEDVYLEADSQDGQFLAIVAQALYGVAAVGASTYNSFSPATAQGTGLSRVVKINGISRRVPTYSTVDLEITGTVGTVLTDCVAEDTLGQKWDIPPTTIPLAATITVTATAQEEGAIQAQADTVNIIFTPTLGWLTVNNPDAATPGEPVESDAALRQRQALSTANPSSTVFGGTIGAVANVEGVTMVKGYENDTDVTDGNGIPEHSISLVVAGGDAVEIAQAILDHKGPGCGTYGTTSEDVEDEKGIPYTINFYRPTQATIGVEVTIDPLTGYTAGYATLIKQAVADYINALGIGDDVLITKLYVPANLPGTDAGATFDITLLRIKKNAGGFGTSNITIAFNEQPVCDPETDVTILP